MTIRHLETLVREFARGGTQHRLFTSWRDARRWADDLARSQGDVDVVTAHALIAETGSVVLWGGEGQRRSQGLLAWHCVALVDARAIFPDMAAFLTSLPGDALHEARGSFLIFVTGPSKTADIEKVLVTPAHGPAKVTVAIVDDATNTP
jgi:L-lactate dehydrogenase complex protein LldG